MRERELGCEALPGGLMMVERGAVSFGGARAIIVKVNDLTVPNTLVAK
jgi:hypothetical protein